MRTVLSWEDLGIPYFVDWTGLVQRGLVKRGLVKSVIWEIKRTNFGNQKIISEIKRTNFGNQQRHLRNQTDIFWKWRNHFRNQTDKFWTSKRTTWEIKRTHFRNQKIMWEVKRTHLGLNSLWIQPPLIRSRFYVWKVKTVCLRVLHVVAGANERRLYSQANLENQKIIWEIKRTHF